MKKIAIFSILVLMLTLFITGCNKEKEQAPADAPSVENTEDVISIPTLEELVEINDMENVLKTHTNAYVYAIAKSDNYRCDYIEEAIYLRGDQRVDFHNRTLSVDGEECYYASSVKDGFYGVDSNNVMILMEIGKQVLYDYTLTFEAENPVGQPYIKDNQIVYHAYTIYEADEMYDAIRIDYTLYFNKDTKLLERYEYVRFNEQHVLDVEFSATVTYDVADIESKFDTTAYEIVKNSDDLIELEIIKDYNTPDEITYTYEAPSNATIYAYIDGIYYDVYSDPEYTDMIEDLTRYAGQDKVTLYVKEYEYTEDIRYTVTEEEWVALQTQYNYTLDFVYYPDESLNYIEKCTEDSADMNGDIFVFIEGREYTLSYTEKGWVAYDCTYMELWHGGLLEDFDYNEFTYDEDLKAYINTNHEEFGYKFCFKFENGVLLSKEIEMADENSESGYTPYYKVLYTNIGTTTVEVPEFLFSDEVEFDPDPAKFITEEQWNACANITNYTVVFMLGDDEEQSIRTLKVDGNVYELDGQIMILENEKLYVLEDREGTWYAVETENNISLPGALLDGFEFNDFEFDNEDWGYIQKHEPGAEIIYEFGFNEGVPNYAIERVLADPANPDEYISNICIINGIGTTVITVPEYVIEQ